MPYIHYIGSVETTTVTPDVTLTTTVAMADLSTATTPLGTSNVAMTTTFTTVTMETTSVERTNHDSLTSKTVTTAGTTTPESNSTDSHNWDGNISVSSSAEITLLNCLTLYYLFVGGIVL